MRVLFKIGVLLGYIAASQTVSADTIFLPTPDILVSEIAVNYNYDGGSSTGTFTATGMTSGFTYNTAGDTYGVSSNPGSFSLTMIFNGTSGTFTSGTLSVRGCLPDVSPACDPASTMLASTVMTFLQFSGIADTELVFGFTTLTGDLSLLYGTMAFVKMNNIGFPGSFLSSFTNIPDPLDPDFVFNGNADVGVLTPEPGTWALMAIGFALFAFAKFRRSSLRATA